MIFQLLFTCLHFLLLQLGGLLRHCLDFRIPFLFFALLSFIRGLHLCDPFELKLSALVDYLFEFRVILLLGKLILLVDLLPYLLNFIMHFLLVFCHLVLIEEEGRRFGLDIEIVADVI